MNIQQNDSIKGGFPYTAAVLFDGSYWNSIRKEFGAPNIDLIKLCDELCKPAYRLRTYYFDGKDNHRQSFHDGLKLLPRFEVILGDVVERETTCPHCKQPILSREQKRVDVQLAVQMVHLATSQQVSLIVLVAGDRDFIPSVEIAKHSGVIIRLVHGPKITTSTDLRQLADENLELTDIFLREYLRESKTQIIKQSISKDLVYPKVKVNQEKIKQSQSLFLKAIQNIPPASDGSILASQLGIEMSTIEPNWKNLYGVKSLHQLIEMTKTKLVTPQKKGKVLFLHPNPEYMPKKAPIQIANTQEQAITFMLQALKDLQKTSKKMIRLSVLGLYLAKIEPNWKERYEIKKLSKLVELAGDKVHTKGEGINKHISLKK